MTDYTESTTQTVARVAAQRKKPNKVNAFRALADVMTSIDNHMETEDASEILGDLADLYAFFLPPAPAKPKTAWGWVAKAMGVSDVRFYLNWVYVTADHITATDGHRLHRAPNVDNLAPGYYDKAGTLCHGPDYATYPEVERIIPGKAATLAVDLADFVPHDHPGKFHAHAYAVTDSTNRVGLNLPYVKDAVSMGEPVAVRTVLDGATAVRFDFEGDRVAVVMPMRL